VFIIAVIVQVGSIIQNQNNEYFVSYFEFNSPIQHYFLNIYWLRSKEQRFKN